MRPTFHAQLVNGRFGDAAIFVERLHARAALLFDLGDLAALSSRDLLRIETVLVSHMHMDHFIGFDSLLRVNVGRSKTIRLVGPPGVIACIGHKLCGYTWDLAGRHAEALVFHVYEVSEGLLREARFHLATRFAREDLGERTLRDDLVLEANDFIVRAALLEHHGHSLGFAVSEPIHVNVWRNRVEEAGLPVGPWLKGLKKAVRDDLPDQWPVLLPDGATNPLGELRDLVSVEPGQTLGYVTDVRDTADNRQAIAKLCAGADTLFIDASFAAADAELAAARAHLTTRAAGEIARLAGARRVEPFHFSPRYQGQEAELLAEVREAFCPEVS
ncbi:hypothetical protein ABVV53_10865 [Novosphingobium sp. RD2P27]|uniref:Uncharacterized protein n=1 Tax=Novosphingobium kalidii TaxID=3230299 RepID=A0ABV2D2N9_9SPHN